MSLKHRVYVELGLDEIRKNLLKFTQKAYILLPKRDSPEILELGAGTGVVSMELYHLSHGKITCIDIDTEALEVLKQKVKESNLQNQLTVKNQSLLELDYPKENFDIIWAEGVIQFIGFENALEQWKQYLKPSGNLVIHDDAKDIPLKLDLAEEKGYNVIHHFILPVDEWWDEYYVHLDHKLIELRQKYIDDQQTLGELHKHQDIVNEVKKSAKDFRSVFFILEKK